MKTIVLAHWEKLLLGVLLAALVVVMTLQTRSLQQAREQVKIDADAIVNITSGKPMIEPLDPSFFNARIEITPDRLWQKNHNQGSLLDPAPFVFARDGSPFALHYDTKTNPFTRTPDTDEGEVITRDPGDDPILPILAPDDDGDGVNNAQELALKRDPRRAEPADTDTDNDGFSDLAEIKAKTHPGQPASRPPLASSLTFVNAVRKPLPLMLRTVTCSNPDDKTTWDVQIRTLRNGVWRDKFTRIGQTIPGTSYTLTGAEAVTTERDGLEQTAYSVTVRHLSDSEPVTLRQRRLAYAPRRYAKLHYTLPGRMRQVTLGEGAAVTLTDRLGLTESYTIRTISPNSVVLIDTATNEAHAVRRGKAIKGPETGQPTIQR
jgi:hypothetical protein